MEIKLTARLDDHFRFEMGDCDLCGEAAIGKWYVDLYKEKRHYAALSLCDKCWEALKA